VVGSSHAQRLERSGGVPVDLQVQVVSADTVRVNVDIPNRLHGEYSCRKVSNHVPAEPPAQDLGQQVARVAADEGD
jgi:hypothetical protein